jgi:hypothetical protein
MVRMRPPCRGVRRNSHLRKTSTRDLRRGVDEFGRLMTGQVAATPHRIPSPPSGQPRTRPTRDLPRWRKSQTHFNDRKPVDFRHVGNLCASPRRVGPLTPFVGDSQIKAFPFAGCGCWLEECTVDRVHTSRLQGEPFGVDVSALCVLAGLKACSLRGGHCASVQIGKGAPLGLAAPPAVVSRAASCGEQWA